MRSQVVVLGAVVLLIGGVASSAPAPTLSASPNHGIASAKFSLTYKVNGKCTNAKADFYWDGPAGTGKFLMSHALSYQAPACKAVSSGLVPPAGAKVGAHKVYGYQDGGSGPIASTVASATYRIDAAPSSTPTPTSSASTRPSSSASASPTSSSSASPKASHKPSPSASLSRSPVCAPLCAKQSPAPGARHAGSSAIVWWVLGIALGIGAVGGLMFFLVRRSERKDRPAEPATPTLQAISDIGPFPPSKAPAGSFPAAIGVFEPSMTGASRKIVDGAVSVSVTARSGALPEGTSVHVYRGDASVLGAFLPAGLTFVHAYAISWDTPGDAAAPLTLSVSDRAVPTDGVLYHTTAEGLAPVRDAGITAGGWSVAFTAGGGYVMARSAAST